MRGRALLLAVLVAGCAGGGDARTTTTDPPPAPVANADWIQDEVQVPRPGFPGWAQPGLALGPRGGGLVGANVEGSCDAREVHDGVVAPIAADGRVGRPRGLEAKLLAGPVAAGDGYVALIGRPGAGGYDCASPASLVLVDLDTRGQITRRTPLARAAAIDDVELAAAPDGRAVLAWTEVAALATLQTAVRSPGGAVTPKRRLAAGIVVDADVAASADGELLVLYAEAGTIRGVVLNDRGEVGVRRDLDETDQTARVRVALGPGGRAAALWAERDDERQRVRAATAVGGKTRWTAPRTLDTGMRAEDDPDSLALSVAPDGRVLAAWDEDRSGVSIAQAAARQRFRRSRLLADDQRLTAAGLAADGSAVVLVDAEDEGLRSWLRSARTRRFVREEVVHRDPATPAALAFDARGRPVVAWTAGRALRVARRR